MRRARRGPVSPLVLVVALAAILALLSTIMGGGYGCLPDGRVRVGLDQVDMRDISQAYVLASNQSLIAAVAVPTPVPGSPTAADEYADYNGPSLRYTSQSVDGVDFEIRVQLDRPPVGDEAASLERAIRAWDEKGVVDGFGRAVLLGGTGYMHGLYTDPQFGPRWTGATLRWLEDFGSADEQLAMDDLARRLAGWSAAHAVPIKALNFGEQGTR